MASVDDQRLKGGFSRGGAVLRGDTLIKPRGENSAIRHQLLSHLEVVGFEGAPRSRGYDDREERFSFLDGHVAWSRHGVPEPDGVYDMESVRQAMSLIRRFHDATAGHPNASGHETVLHGDLSPQNTVYRPTSPDGRYRPFGFIDFEFVRLGDRMEDLAYAIHNFLALGYPETHKYESEDPYRIRQCWDAYGLDNPSGLIDRMIAHAAVIANGWEKRLRNPVDAAEAELAEVAFRSCSTQLDWIRDHQLQYEAALGAPVNDRPADKDAPDPGLA